MKKPRLVLHIGSQKTGTTSIQQFLAKNRDCLLEQNIYISDNLGGMNHRHAVFLAENTNKREDAFTISSGLKGNDIKKRDFKQKLLNTLESQCERHKDKLWIITSEFFQSRLNTDEEIKRLNDLFSELFSEIKVICYIRDPLSTAISTWSTYVMSGGVARQLPRPGTIFHNNCDHKSLVTRWEKYFNCQEMIIRNYTKDSLVKENVIEDFCSQANIKSDKRFVLPPKSNSSLSYKGILILSKFNSLTQNIEPQQRTKIRKIISKVIHRNFKDFPMYLASKSEIDEYHKLYLESFKWVSDKYFNSYTSIKDLFENKYREKNDVNFVDSLQESDICFITSMLDIYKISENGMSNRIRF